MSAIKTAKRAVADVLKATDEDGKRLLPGVVTTYLPGDIDPPALVVLPGSPYLEQETFAQHQLRLDVLVVVGVGENDVVVDALDDLLDDVVVVLANAGYGIERIADPLPFRIQQGLYLSATVTITTHITL